MKILRRPILVFSSLLFCLGTTQAEPDPKESQAPRWKLLGNDQDLRNIITESDQIVLLCIFRTSLENLKPPFATVVLEATVVNPLKGSHELGNRITLRFQTDSLPLDGKARSEFISTANAKNLGSLRIAFLNGKKSPSYDCEWLDLPELDPAMLDFISQEQHQ